MPISCPNFASCEISRPRIVRRGRYFRTSDSAWIQRFSCKGCNATFSTATFEVAYRQRKRNVNEAIRRIYASTGSLRRTAVILELNRKTVVRKFLFLGLVCLFNWRTRNLAAPKATIVEFDDLETFEHSKCKPLSVTLAVEAHTRRILGFEVSLMPAKGRLVERAKRYGPRRDERRQGRHRLFGQLKDLVQEDAIFKSDSNPHYVSDVKRHFPQSSHRRYLGRRGSTTGQGEIKKGRFDPLFSLNHTCAKLRADINRLIRKTWCTTKNPDRLFDHIAIFADYHNEQLLRA